MSKVGGSGWEVKLLGVLGIEQSSLSFLILVQDFAASLTKESPASHWFPSDDSGVL